MYSYVMNLLRNAHTYFTHSNVSIFFIEEWFLLQPLGSVVTLFPTDLEVPGSIAGSAVGFFSSGLYGQRFLCFIALCSCSVVFGKGPCILPTADQRRPLNCVHALI